MNCSYPECKCPIDAYGNTPCQMDVDSLSVPVRGNTPDPEQVKTFLQRLKIQSMRTTNDISKILESLE